MEDNLLEGLATLRHDEEADGGAARGEGLFDRAATGDDLFTLGERQDLRQLALGRTGIRALPRRSVGPAIRSRTEA
ncbi:MAG TPA: hypothetical protein VKC59_00580 [Candidatus Limnocylindrales bacterium]|nr:hypothetical protein [Candidatus Limnocylindrales bacterium]